MKIILHRLTPAYQLPDLLYTFTESACPVKHCLVAVCYTNLLEYHHLHVYHATDS